MLKGIFKRLRIERDDKDDMRPLHASVITEARLPIWYREGQVPDTIDGRFEMISAIVALAIIRLEQLGADAQLPMVRLADLFAEEMEGQLRELGIGDAVVGKHMGKLVGALGGRLGAYRDALAAGNDLDSALIRNLYRGQAPDPTALAVVAERLRGIYVRVTERSVDDLIAGLL